jgi:hypothetical protein
MATYYLAVGFDADDTRSDGTHYDAEYGFAVDSGSGLQAVGNSGSAGKTFETVTIPAVANGVATKLSLVLATNLMGIDQYSAYVRCAFRPAHDVAPSTNPPTSPLGQSDTQALLTGAYLKVQNPTPPPDVSFTETTAVGDTTDYGLPTSYYATVWTSDAMTLNVPNNQHGTVRFELTIEVTVTATGSGATTTYNFKVDPEMLIDY